MPFYTNDSIQQVIDATDFVSLAGNYLKLERRNHLWWGCCPFHNEKTPSFQIDPEKKVFYCFGCHKGGNILQFFMDVEGLSFAEAILELANRANITLISTGADYKALESEKKRDEIYVLYEKVSKAFHHILLNTKEGEQGLKYLTNRCVSQEIINTFNLGIAPADKRWLNNFLQKKGYKPQFLETCGLFSKNYPEIAFFSNRIMFPIYNRQGRVIAFGGRTLSDNDPKSPKYLNSYDMEQYKKKENLFGFYQALNTIRKERSIILCEGYMDVLAFHQAGITNACAPLGTALTETQVKMISRLVDTIYLCFDTDEAGVNATFRAIELILPYDLELKVIIVKDAKDPGEVFEKNGAEGLKNIVKNAIMYMDFFVQKMTKFGISTADGKAKACKFLFPYINLITSQVKREAIIADISSRLGVSQEALYKDFVNQKLPQFTPKNEIVPVPAKNEVENDFEMRIIQAVVANQELFKTLRSQVSSDDFFNQDAKDVFIALEECYRDGTENYQALLSHCHSERIKNAVVKAAFSEDFSNDPEKSIQDGIKQIKIKNLEFRRETLTNKLRIIEANMKTDESNDECSDIMADMMDIDRQIISLKQREEV